MPRFNTVSYPCSVLVVVLALAAPSECLAAGAMPNVVVIVADDLGYGDIGVHGCKDIPTPHIDSLARDGVRCTQGYLSAPQCSPTRAGLLTGRYQQRFGHEHNRSYPDSALPLSESTLAHTMKVAGYATGLVGKWHLGSDEAHHPMSRGFDEFFGFLGGANPFLPRPGGTVPRILANRQDANERQYLTDAFGREAAAFIESHRRRPFFLYLAFNAPHMPLEATPKYLERFKSIPDEGRRTYAAMVSAMDDAIGVVLAKLESAGLEEKTLVFFISDNGGPARQNHSSNAPLAGVKGEVHEGGIRTPFLVRWKGRLPAGKVYDRPVIQLDIFPTVMAAARIPAPAPDVPLDGVNLLPYLTGEKPGDPHDVLYWRFTFPPNRPDAPRWAIRRGDWKLLSDVDAHDARGAPAGRKLKLINLASDPQEATDLSAQHPEKAKALEAEWTKWSAELVNPAPDAGDPRRPPPRGAR